MAGVALGLAAALKPQLAGLFVIYLAMRRQWMPFVVACGVGAVILGIGILRMELAGIDWLSGLRSNVSAFKLGGVGDPGPGNPYRYQMVNLEPVLRALWDAPRLMSNVAILAGVVLVAMAWRIARRAQSLDGELLAMSLLTLVSLLVVYHRYYDAAMLAVPMLWLFGRMGRRAAPAVWIAAIAMLVVMLPTAGAIGRITIDGRLPSGLLDSWAWRHGVYLLDAWAMTWMTIAITVVALRPRPEVDQSASSVRSTAKN